LYIIRTFINKAITKTDSQIQKSAKKKSNRKGAIYNVTKVAAGKSILMQIIARAKVANGFH
jgi:predicted Ser/Thr protein kinase